MLPNATIEQKIASGFNRKHRGNSEGGVIPEEYAVEHVADRVETTATVFMVPDVGLHPMLRPQVRSIQAKRVLPAFRLLQQPAGKGQGEREFTAGDPSAVVVVHCDAG